MGIYIGIAVIAVALAVIFAGAWGCEKENRRYWHDQYFEAVENENNLVKKLDKADKRAIKAENERDNALEDASTFRNERDIALGKCERLADENLRLEQILREYGQHGTVIPVDDRKVYFERDGIRHIFIDNDYQGWYDPNHEIVEVDD